MKESFEDVMKEIINPELNKQDYFILKDKQVVGCEWHEWARWFETADRRIGHTKYDNGIVVSTAFLGLNHNFSEEGLPLVFETMVFNISDEEYQERCTTYAEALTMHIMAEKYVKDKFGDKVFPVERELKQ